MFIEKTVESPGKSATGGEHCTVDVVEPPRSTSARAKGENKDILCSASDNGSSNSPRSVRTVRFRRLECNRSNCGDGSLRSLLSNTSESTNCNANDTTTMTLSEFLRVDENMAKLIELRKKLGLDDDDDEKITIGVR